MPPPLPPSSLHPHQCPACGHAACPKATQQGLKSLGSETYFYVSWPRHCPQCGTIFDPPASRFLCRLGVALGLGLLVFDVFLLTTKTPDRDDRDGIMALLGVSLTIIIACVRRLRGGSVATVLKEPDRNG